jgi:Mg/Co/Ni transporter MgtE
MYMTSVNADTLRDGASDAVEKLARAAAPAIDEGKRQAGVLLDQSGELIDRVNARANETVADLGGSLIAYTKKSPLIALMLAVGAGALLFSVTRSIQSRR